MPGEKSVLVAYLLWFVGGCGLLGFHHVYLGRRMRALAYTFTLGGLGFGALLDLYLIPGYVEEVNRVPFRRAGSVEPANGRAGSGTPAAPARRSLMGYVLKVGYGAVVLCQIFVDDVFWGWWYAPLGVAAVVGVWERRQQHSALWEQALRSAGEDAAAPTGRGGRKSLRVAYTLWLVGGWCGLHHWYLQRDSQAVVWMTTFGGFGVGWVSDAFSLPQYVQEANMYTKDSPYVRDARKHAWAEPRGFSVIAGVSSLALAYYYAYLLRAFDQPAYAYATDFLSDMGWEDVDFPFASHLHAALYPDGRPYPWASEVAGTCLATLALCCGRKTWGMTQRPFLMASVAALWAVATHQSWKDGELLAADVATRAVWGLRACLAVAQGTRPEMEPGVGKRHPVSRLARLLLVLAGMGVVLSHAEITDTQGRSHRASALLSVLGERVRVAVASAHRDGWQKTFTALMNTAKGEEETALGVLGLSKGASASDIRSAFRKMSRIYHPDLNPDAPAEMIVEINKAYETLNRIHKVRGQRT